MLKTGWKQRRKDKAEEANGFVEEALKELCETFRESATLFLEEKHLHNEFDQILRTKIKEGEDEEDEEKKINVTATTKKENDVAGVEFPLIMNEYKTVYHYSRDRDFEIRGDGSRAGSLDYVWLWDEWVEDNSYCTAVNKDVDFRCGEKGERDTDRYLVVVEFKFDHYAKYMKTADGNKIKTDDQDETGRQKGSRESAMKTMKDDLPLDLNKVDNEEPVFGHVVYFNSQFPLKRDCVEKAFKEDLKPKKPRGTWIKLWYTQGGVRTRFSKEENKFSHTQIVGE